MKPSWALQGSRKVASAVHRDAYRGEPDVGADADLHHVSGYRSQVVRAGDQIRAGDVWARTPDVEDDVVEGVADLHDEPAVVDEGGDVENDGTVDEIEQRVCVDRQVVRRDDEPVSRGLEVVELA